MPVEDTNIGIGAETPVTGAGREEVVIIKKAVNGWIIAVGCKTFVATSWDFIQKELKLYFEDPIAAERKWMQKGKKGRKR